MVRLTSTRGFCEIADEGVPLCSQSRYSKFLRANGCSWIGFTSRTPVLWMHGRGVASDCQMTKLVRQNALTLNARCHEEVLGSDQVDPMEIPMP
jgi:hypothetical protein